jgi:putative redox protein
MEMVITFPDGRYMEGRYKEYVVRMGPSGKPWWEGPTPGAFDLFVMSIGLCTGSVVWAFVDNRDLSIAGTRILMQTTVDEETHMIVHVEMILNMPGSFPAKYKDAAARAAEACAVKRHILHPPHFTTEVKIPGVEVAVRRPEK